MSTQTRPRIGDRVRVISVECDAMRGYVGRVGTVQVPKGIPNGCQDHVSVCFDKAKRFKAVSVFFKPECLTTNIDSSIPSEDLHLCSPNSISVQELEPDSPQLELLPVDSSSLGSVKLMTSAATGCETDSQESQSIQMCDRSGSTQVPPILSPPRRPANPSASMESAEEPLITETAFQTCCELSSRPCPDFSPLKTLRDSSAAPSPQNSQSQGVTLDSHSGAFPAAGTMQSGLVSGQETLAAPFLGADYCWLESPGALSSDTSRIPGLCKSEGKWQKSGLLKKGEVASPDFLEDSFGLPKGWTSPQESRPAQQLLEQDDRFSEIRSTGESVRSHSQESSTSTHLFEKVIARAKAKVGEPPEGHLWTHQIEVVPALQQRVCVNFAVVSQYKEMLELSDPPPVTVYRVGERFILVDGFHRLHASIGAGRELIPAIIKEGSWEDALIASCTANAYNGQAMSSADKRQAVTTMVETLEKLPDEDPRKKWSNREIARQTGASEATVRNIKAELEMSAKISQFNEGDLIQVICPSGYQPLTYFRTGTLGTVGALDKKKGLFIVPDNGSLDWDGRMQPSAWVHPDLVIKSDALVPAKFAHDEKESEQDADGSDRNGAASHYTSVKSVKQETTEQGKGLALKTTGDATLPSIPPNPDTDGRTEHTPAAMTNGPAIRNGKPDVVATEIAIGIGHLSPEQLAWVLTAAANNGLSDKHLKAVVKAGKEALNKRHHPEYNACDHRSNQRRESAPLSSSLARDINWDEVAVEDDRTGDGLDDEDLTFGVPDEDSELGEVIFDRWQVS